MESILAQALGQEDMPSTVEEKRLLLSRLLGRLAHEIRNPLSSLDIHLQLMEEDLTRMAPQAKDKLAGRLDIIHGELHRLEKIVKHFLSLASPSTVELQLLDVGQVLGHVCELLRPEAIVRGIELVLQVDPFPPPLTADSAQLTQALVNLVINAIQAVEGGGRVEVHAHAHPENNWLAIEIRDSGPGIPLEKQSAIFEPFYTTRTEGTGLGLWIVQQIITAHGGAVEVANRPEGGAVFALRLPLRRNEPVHG